MGVQASCGRPFSIHTDINVKKRSNHPETMKRAIIKGFADRARALCDKKHLTEELNNMEDVYVANGYPRETVRRFMEQRLQQKDKREQEEQESRDFTIFRKVA